MGKYNREPNRKYRELEPKEPETRKFGSASVPGPEEPNFFGSQARLTEEPSPQQISPTSLGKAQSGPTTNPS